jgi:hypothetical protein
VRKDMRPSLASMPSLPKKGLTESRRRAKPVSPPSPTHRPAREQPTSTLPNHTPHTRGVPRCAQNSHQSSTAVPFDSHPNLARSPSPREHAHETHSGWGLVNTFSLPPTMPQLLPVPHHRHHSTLRQPKRSVIRRRAVKDDGQHVQFNGVVTAFPCSHRRIERNRMEVPSEK